MTREIRVRKATIGDYLPLCELFDELDTYHRINLPHIFQKPNGPAREEDFYLGLIADENVGLFVAESTKHIVGFIQAYLRDAPDIPIFLSRRYAMIDSLFIRLPFRNQGIGRILVEKVHAWANEKGAASIELNVYIFNEQAISFYEGLGYRTISQRMSKDIRE